MGKKIVKRVLWYAWLFGAGFYATKAMMAADEDFNQN